MHDGHGRIAAFAFPHEQKRERFSDDHAAAQDDDMRAGNLGSAFDE